MDLNKRKKLSNLWVISGLIVNLVSSFVYPFVYYRALQAIPSSLLSFEQIISCLGVAFFGFLWNRIGDKLFRHFTSAIVANIIGTIIIIIVTLLTKNLSAYYLINVVVAATVSTNMTCGYIKMKTLINPTGEEREHFDNRNNTAYSIGTLCGATLALLSSIDFTTAFVASNIVYIIDDIVSIYIYKQIKSSEKQS